MPKAGRRVLFVQVTEAGGYPPIIHASHLMANAGWEVMILNAPVSGHNMRAPPHPRVSIHHIRQRSSHIVRPQDLLRYSAAAARMAVTFRPHVLYASDPLAAGPALAAAKLARSTLIYHEHDTPNPGALNPRIAHLRALAARKAELIVYPNEQRAELARQQLGFRSDQLRIVWNVPCRNEIPEQPARTEFPLVLHYHGNISPVLLPESVVDALKLCVTSWRLRIAGYESPGAAGYAARLVERGKQPDGSRVEYAGQFPRDRLLPEAAQASVGLALLPARTGDVNLNNIMGASNKVFDYMAAGLAVLVPNGPEWIRCFVEPGYGRPCDPADSRSIAAQLDWFAQHPEETRAMGNRGRGKIDREWNYDRAFHPVLSALDAITPERSVARVPSPILLRKIDPPSRGG